MPPYFAFGGANWSLTAARLKPWMRRRFGLDTVFTEVDHDQRAGYEDREPGTH